MLYNMKDLLVKAREHQFAVPAFNISSLDIFQSVLRCAEELCAPVIMEVHPDELSYIGEEFIQMMKLRMSNSSIPCVLHLDHGSELKHIIKAIHAGFTSVMIDGSRLAYDDNVGIVKQAVSLAHPLHISVEAELGTIGATGVSFEGGTSEIIYTDPITAKEFVEETGIDTLAVAIGTAHGLYPKGFDPKLQLELLKEIEHATDLPLVLHGGSGNPDHEVEEAVRLGICKVNISSDVKSAYFKEVKHYMDKHPQEYEPNVILKNAQNAADRVVKHKLQLLHTIGKAVLYTGE